MRAVVVSSEGAAPRLGSEMPAPAAAAGEVLVRVRASSANPVDNAIAAGMLTGMVPHEYPITLGRDYAGVVEEVGADVEGLSAGDEVLGFLPFADPAVHAGAWAELIAVRADSLARKPAGVDVAAAGAAPLAAITALTAIDALELSEGETVLIVGAAGGVGSFAVQLAAQAGATVVAPALEEDEAYLRDLGVTRRLERDQDLPDDIEADALLDLVSYAPGTFDAALAPGARVASPNSAAGDGPGRTNVMAAPTAENLRRLAELLESGALRVPIEETFELERAAEALQALGTAHTRGKLAISLA